MPRAADAHATTDKWHGWILDVAGHGEESARVFHAGPQDSERIWAAIAPAAAWLHLWVSEDVDFSHLDSALIVDGAPDTVEAGPVGARGAQARERGSCDWW